MERLGPHPESVAGRALDAVPQRTHNPRADAQYAPVVSGDLNAAVAPSARTGTARDRERGFYVIYALN